MPRLFVAVELTREALARTERVEERLRRALRGRTRIRWTKPGGRHITLAFLGQVRDEKIELVVEAMREVASRHTTFSVNVGGLGAFPNERRARVVWLAAGDEQGRLAALARDIQAALRQRGFDVDERDFRGHVTLGRVADRSGFDIGEVRHLDDEEAIGVVVEALALFESQLAPAGAKYRRLREVRLGGVTGIGA